MYPFGFEAAPKLRLLEVDRCKELKSIHVLPSLKELKLKWLFLLTAVSELNISISKAEDCGEHVQGYSPRLLETLEIYYCHSLRAPSTKGPPPSLMLQRVVIIHCKNLDALVNDAGTLPATIEEHEIVGCPLLNWKLQALTSPQSSADTRFISCTAQSLYLTSQGN